MENETTQPINPTPEKNNKKSAYTALIVLIVIILIAWGLSELKKPTESIASNPCLIDLTATVYKVATSSAPLTEVQAADAVFNHFFSAYKNMPDCADSALEDFKIISIGTSTPLAEPNRYTIPLTIDIKPLSMTETKWASSSPEAVVDGEWIRGKKIVLSIWHHENIYQLIVF